MAGTAARPPANYAHRASPTRRIDGLRAEHARMDTSRRLKAPSYAAAASAAASATQLGRPRATRAPRGITALTRLAGALSVRKANFRRMLAKAAVCCANAGTINRTPQAPRTSVALAAPSRTVLGSRLVLSAWVASTNHSLASRAVSLVQAASTGTALIEQQRLSTAGAVSAVDTSRNRDEQNASSVPKVNLLRTWRAKNV